MAKSFQSCDMFRFRCWFFDRAFPEQKHCLTSRKRLNVIKRMTVVMLYVVRQSQDVFRFALHDIHLHLVLSFKNQTRLRAPLTCLDDLAKGDYKRKRGEGCGHFRRWPRMGGRLYSLLRTDFIGGRCFNQPFREVSDCVRGCIEFCRDYSLLLAK